MAIDDNPRPRSLESKLTYKLNCYRFYNRLLVLHTERAADLLAQLAVYAPPELRERAAACIEEAEFAVEFTRAA